MHTIRYQDTLYRPTHRLAPVIRVAWDLQLAGRNQTGTGVYAAQLLSHLKQPGLLDVRVLDGWHLPRNHGGGAGRAARTLIEMAWNHAGLPVAVDGLRADVLHAPAFVAPLWGNCPLVVTIHDTIYRHFPEQYPGWWVAYMNLVMPRVVARAAAVIVGSNNTKQDLVRDYGVDPARVHVIYYGVDHERFTPFTGPDAEAALDQYGIRSDYVLHVGALVARKNIPLLLEAVARLKAQGHWGTRQLVLAGPVSPGMPGAEAIRAAVTRLELTDDVVFVGHVPDDVLPRLYARAEVLAFPSRYEGFGFPLIEAMSCGTPVVAAAGSSVSELVGSAGRLVPGDDPEALASALREVLTDQRLRTTLRARGLRRAAEFTWERAARQTADVYRQVVDSTGGGTRPISRSISGARRP
jgi:glycosyltransferase involved in cell wall biosynthesis